MPKEAFAVQIGFGGFGPTHLQAWRELGFLDRLYVADPDPAARAACRRLGVPDERITGDYRTVLDRVTMVDIVCPTVTHFDICKVALGAGKDLFVEKPLTVSAAEAEHVRALAAQTGRVVQVGLYFRFHPFSRYVKARADAGDFGDVRYLSGRFLGFKRTRRDSGALHNDAIHYVDLFTWLTGDWPAEVFAITRDHFGRGMEDFAILLLRYPTGIVAKVEVGYIQPGRWPDTVVPGAMASKEITVVGSRASVEVDFEGGRITWHDARHEEDAGVWRPVLDGSHQPSVPVADPWQVVAAELAAFLESVATRRAPDADALRGGVWPARVLDAALRSAQENRPVAVAR